MRIPLIPPPGVNSDDTEFSQEMRFSDADNVRFFDGKAETIGGWNKVTGSQMTGVCRNIIAWLDNDGFETLALGTHSKLYALVGGSLADITPSSGFTAGAENGAGGPGFGSGDYGEGDFGEGSLADYFPLTWSLANWGENLLANPRGQSIFLWQNDTGTPAAVISNAPDNVTAMMVTPERQVLALGCNEEGSGTFNPRCIRGSDIEDNTDWTTTASNNAFEHILEATGGARIVTGRMIGPYVAIWTDFGLWIGQFIGDPGQTYRFDLVATGCGLIGPNAVAIHSQRAWWWTPDRQCYTWSPGESPQLVGCPIQSDFANNIATGQFEKIAAGTISKFEEIWWFYPDGRDGLECSRYVQINTQAPADQPLAWSRGTLARSALVESGLLRFSVMASPDGYIYSHEDGNSADGGAISWSATIALPQIDEGGRFVMLKGIEPDFDRQQGAVSLSFSLRKYPQGSSNEKGPFTLTPMTVRKHFTMSGRSGEITFTGNSAPSYVRFGKPILLAEPMGAE